MGEETRLQRRMSADEWEQLSRWLQIPIEILTQLSGPEILQATQRAITRDAREKGERLASQVKLRGSIK